MNRRVGRSRSKGTRLVGSLRALWTHHLDCLLSGPVRLAARPLGALMTVGVIAIALAMPGLLHLVVKNLQRLGGQQENVRALSVFLHPGTAQAAVNALRERLQRRQEVAQVSALHPDESLAEFEQAAGFADAVSMLGSNPLPWVLVVTPDKTVTRATQVAQLAAEIETEVDVDFAQVDLEWLDRLNALLDLAGRASLLLATVLGVAVVLIVGNTIRLELQTRSDEIVITRLLGATDGFVRRPFLYLGAWYGLSGGLAAVLIVSALVWLAQGPVDWLAASYQSEFAVTGVGTIELAVLIVGGALTGWLGAALAVARQISRLDPG